MANNISIIKAVATALFISTGMAKAQDLKLSGVEYFSYGKSSIEGKPGKGNLSFQQVGAFVNIPVVSKNKKTIFINGLRYDWVRISVHLSDSNVNSSSDFHALTYSLRGIHRFRNEWTGSFFTSLALSGDFISPLSHNDLVLRGGMAVSKQLNKRLQVGGGIIYNNNVLGSPPVLPLLQLVYKNNRSQMIVFLPAIVEYAYKFDSKQKFKTGGRLTFNGFYFNYSRASDLYLSAVDKVSNALANIGPTLSYKMTNYLQLEAFGGISTMRKYRYMEYSGNEIKINSRTSGFVNIGISFVPINNK